MTDAKFVVVISADDAVVVDTMDIEPMVVYSEVNTLSKDTVDAKGCSIVGDDSITKGNQEISCGSQRS
jgi:hypothetical protein